MSSFLGTESTRAVILIMILCLPRVVWGWGLLKELNTDSNLRSRLVTKVLTKNTINYCLDLPTSLEDRFDRRSLSLQIESALRLWLDPVRSLGVQNTRLNALECNLASKDLDLRVEVRPKEPRDISRGAFTLAVFRSVSSPGFMRVKIVSDYVWQERREIRGIPHGDYHWIDFQSLVHAQTGETISSLLETVSFKSPKTVESFARDRALSYNQVYYSTYRGLIHEFGHAFGLCDTVELQYEKECDPHYRSAGSQPKSVMRSASSFYLTPDDQIGIRALFMRFKKPAKAD